MNIQALRIKWAAKLLRAKFFVVMTEKESAIVLDSVDPDSLDNIFALESQAAELGVFSDGITELIQRHNKRIAELGGQPSVDTAKAPKAKTTVKKTGKTGSSIKSKTTVRKPRNGTKVQPGKEISKKN